MIEPKQEDLYPMKSISLALVGLLALGTAAAHAQTQSDVSSADKSFATKAAAAGMAEVSEAQIAQSKSGRQDVKDFAQKMIADHSKANDQLKQIASANGITLPTEPSKSDRSKASALSKKSGTAVDKQYIKDQQGAHKDAVALFTKESKNGKNPALKDFATQTLPTLQGHKQMIDGMKS
jgi:putative membrane protein